MVWLNMNDVLRSDTTAEAEWAAKFAPNASRPPRHWRTPSSPVSPEEAAPLLHESDRERIVRLSRAGHSRISVAVAVGKSISRVAQVMHEEGDFVVVAQTPEG